MLFIDQHFTNLVSNNKHRVWQKGLFCTGWLDHSVHMATGSTAEFNRYAAQGLFNALPMQKQICTLKICILFSWHASKCDELTFHFPRSWILSTVVIFPSRLLGTQGKNAHHLHYIQVHFWAKSLGLASHYLVKLADNYVCLHLLLGRPGRKTQAWCSREPPSNQPSMLPGSTVEAASSSGSPAELLATGGFPHIFSPWIFLNFFLFHF